AFVRAVLPAAVAATVALELLPQVAFKVEARRVEVAKEAGENRLLNASPEVGYLAGKRDGAVAAADTQADVRRLRGRLEGEDNGRLLHERLHVSRQTSPEVLAVGVADRFQEVRQSRPARRLEGATDVIDNPGPGHQPLFPQAGQHGPQALVLLLIVPQ